MAIADFNKNKGSLETWDLITTYHKNIPYAEEETRAQVKYFMDRIKSSSQTFRHWLMIIMKRKTAFICKGLFI